MNTLRLRKSVQRILFRTGFKVQRVGTTHPDPGYVRVRALVRDLPRDLSLPPESRRVRSRVALRPGRGPSSRKLFRGAGSMLPCWREEDLAAEGNWLLEDSVYPLYYRLFSRLAGASRRIRFLEIGVRSGYVGVVFAHAARKGLYVGIDNNAYLSDGLDRASASYRYLQKKHPGFDFVLLEGDSTSVAIRRAVRLSGPFDVIHIDGDHSFVGKLFDLEVASGAVAPGGLVLVDDIDHLGAVREATAAALHAAWYSGWAYVPTLRGMAVLAP